MSFEYSHGAPSYPTDVLPDGNRRGYIEPLDDGTPPESQVFDVAASGSVDDQAVISISGGDHTYVSESGAGVPIAGSIRVTGAGYHDVSVVHVNVGYPPKGNISYIIALANINDCAIIPPYGTSNTESEPQKFVHKGAPPGKSPILPLVREKRQLGKVC